MATTEQVADFIVERRVSNAPLVWMAEVLDMLVPLLDDSGRLELQEVRRKWLLGDDEVRIEIALMMEGAAVPFASEAERTAALTAISQRVPHLSARCTELLQRSVDAEG